MRKSMYFIISMIAFLGMSTSCDSDCCSEQEYKTLVAGTKFLTRYKGEIKTYLQSSALELPVDAIQYDVDMYKVSYTTLYKNTEITASGVVVLPKTTDPVGMLSFQHGTITANTDAPSVLALNEEELIYYAALGTMGMIAVFPDFIGFGASDDVMHPYYVEEYSAGAVRDLLVAAAQLAEENGVSFNHKLFLAGYSQGGYVTMATHKSLEAEPMDGFNLLASFPASGGYDVKGMQEYFFDLETYYEPYYLAYVARSYQTAYDWTQPLSEFFNEPYASRIPDLFNGTHSGSYINSQLDTTVSDLITFDIQANIETDTKYKYLVDAFIANSIVDWTPTIKMYMYHGDADITVPYQNSVDSYNTFIDGGASTEIVTLTTLPDATHGTGVAPYIQDFITKVLSLK